MLKLQKLEAIHMQKNSWRSRWRYKIAVLATTKNRNQRCSAIEISKSTKVHLKNAFCGAKKKGNFNILENVFKSSSNQVRLKKVGGLIQFSATRIRCTKIQNKPNAPRIAAQVGLFLLGYYKGVLPNLADARQSSASTRPVIRQIASDRRTRALEVILYRFEIKSFWFSIILSPLPFSLPDASALHPSHLIFTYFATILI